jgi:hypothetical protein
LHTLRIENAKLEGMLAELRELRAKDGPIDLPNPIGARRVQ